MTIESTQLKQIIEGALLAAGQPLDIKRLQELFTPEDSKRDDESPVTKEDIQAALQAIVDDCEGRGFELREVGSGWRFQVRKETAQWVNRLWEEKPQKYSRAMLETLALIAYRQPITRGDIEEIRGVAVSSHIIKTLTERDWVKVVGHRDVPGRPSLYATTRTFLDYFNLTSLEELPSLGELADLEELNSELNLEQGSETSPEPASDSEIDITATESSSPADSTVEAALEDILELSLAAPGAKECTADATDDPTAQEVAAAVVDGDSAATEEIEEASWVEQLDTDVAQPEQRHGETQPEALGDIDNPSDNPSEAPETAAELEDTEDKSSDQITSNSASLFDRS